MKRKFRLGLIINPLAGLGGSVGLKGSDGLAKQALERGAIPQAHLRVAQALQVILPYRHQIEIITSSADMGADLALDMGFDVQVIHQVGQQTSAQDTINAVTKIKAFEVDLLLFAGGDGTARDVLVAIDDTVPVLGVPAGVKIHSGVYGVTPNAAGMVVKMLIEGQLVTLMSAEVIDIDEAAFRQGRVKARRFGEMLVPAEPRYIQATKVGARESEELVLADIAADVVEQMDSELYIIGSGSTVAAIMEELRLKNTLLGVDLVHQQQLIGSDLGSSQLFALIDKRPCKLILTPIGGQGHLLGRGNQQLSAALVRQIGRDNIIIIATKTKLATLEGRPLLIDSGDPQLDEELRGYYKVITGYHDYVLYQVANPD